MVAKAMKKSKGVKKAMKVAKKATKVATVMKKAAVRAAVKRRPAMAPQKKLAAVSPTKKTPADSGGAAPPLQVTRRYFALRHGESEANVAGIILSDPAVGIVRYGLTADGRKMVAETAKDFQEQVLRAGGLDSTQVMVVCSDFKRTCETAEGFCSALGIASFRQSRAMELRERYFGELEGGPDTQYDNVWRFDAVDPKSTPFGCESSQRVQQRTLGLVAKLEQDLPPDVKLVVLVSHGDALQILQTGFEHLCPSKHRTLKPMGRAELRELVVKT